MADLGPAVAADLRARHSSRRSPPRLPQPSEGLPQRPAGPHRPRHLTSSSPATTRRRRPRSARRCLKLAPSSWRERRTRNHRDPRRRRVRGGRASALARPSALQDPGSDQAPADHAGPGHQGRARQQGRGADHLSVARRPLLRADANTARGGGVSRKITSITDRRRLKDILEELDIPEGMGVIGAPPAPSARRPRSSATMNICCGCGTRSAS